MGEISWWNIVKIKLLVLFGEEKSEGLQVLTLPAQLKGKAEKTLYFSLSFHKEPIQCERKLNATNFR